MAETPDIPIIQKPDIQILLQDLAQARRDIHEERRNSERAISAERDRAKWEIERIRTEGAEKVRLLELENHALARALGRIEAENERLREENAVLRHAKTEVPARISEPPAKAPNKDPRAVAILPNFGVATMGNPSVVPPASPPLGKTVPLDPSGK